MFEYIKAKIRLFLKKEAEEITDAKRKGECLLELANIFQTNQHDPWAHLATITTALEKVSLGEEAVRFELRDGTIMGVRFEGKCVATIMAKEVVFHHPVVELMTEWINIHLRYPVKN